MDMSKRHCTRSQEKGTGQSHATIRSDSEAVPVPPVLPGPPSGQVQPKEHSNLDIMNTRLLSLYPQKPNPKTVPNLQTTYGIYTVII